MFSNSFKQPYHFSTFEQVWLCVLTLRHIAGSRSCVFCWYSGKCWSVWCTGCCHDIYCCWYIVVGAFDAVPIQDAGCWCIWSWGVCSCCWSICCSRRVGDSRWWGSLTVVLAWNKATPFVGQPYHKNNSPSLSSSSL